jgi:hypothetical protein
MELFPEEHLIPGELTVISISQHSKNDMSTWSMEVEEEREALMQSVSFRFINSFLIF